MHRTWSNRINNFPNTFFFWPSWSLSFLCRSNYERWQKYDTFKRWANVSIFLWLFFVLYINIEPMLNGCIWMHLNAIDCQHFKLVTFVFSIISTAHRKKAEPESNVIIKFSHVGFALVLMNHTNRTFQWSIRITTRRNYYAWVRFVFA